ncbi:MAG: hypothetical protein KKB66_18420 [Alphaproteobacteria bacterium]|uniref:Uncharacterized protein n=1 Tax=viral metagenome TaxID=1070528 RepID=A0A6H1ZGR2_9ZZZZ|nr:hypothetical protein [Alphaproteobacteria bacterium]MBU0803579.1 hypothetical protein [Alphaproteobacteria bacterium]MBU0873124.1 hypothetical protein [Alphaproteobacteria bacterium]MBU1402506.1 hypothetical protein [Alphaproteobacteria bacterium]MBU1593148.1 hypothetical protein [Alphaproteobacteria bacterium]
MAADPYPINTLSDRYRYKEIEIEIGEGEGKARGKSRSKGEKEEEEDFRASLSQLADAVAAETSHRLWRKGEIDINVSSIWTSVLDSPLDEVPS